MNERLTLLKKDSYKSCLFCYYDPIILNTFQNSLASVVKTIILITFFLISSLWATDWTILVYMAADNGLSEFARQDINEMESVILPSGTQVIVQVDFSQHSPSSGTYRYKIRHDTTDEINSQLLVNLGELNSGDYRNLKSFVQWGFDHYPANKKALIIWSHADSWYKGNDTKWLCPDNSSEQLMSVSAGDLRNALISCPKLDILIFDACSMQSVEVLGEVYEKADYVIASEDVVPATGFPYQDILPIWYGSPRTVASQIPELYANSYVAYGSQNPCPCAIRVSCSSISTANWNTFQEKLYDFVQIHIDNPQLILNKRNECYNLNSYNAEIDIKELITKLNIVDNHQVNEELLNELDNMILSKAAIEYPVDIGNLTIWFPFESNTFNNWWEQYLNLTVANSEWITLVGAALNAVNVPLPPPQILKINVLFQNLHVRLKASLLPKKQAIHLRFVPDNATQNIINYIDDYQLFTPLTSEKQYNLSMIESSGWLYFWTTDIYNMSSLIDSVYVHYQHPKQELVVYPNPVRKGQVTYIAWWTKDELKGDNTHKYITVYNSSGQCVLYSRIENSSEIAATIPTEQLSSGIYIAVLKIGKNILKTRFAVVK